TATPPLPRGWATSMPGASASRRILARRRCGTARRPRPAAWRLRPSWRRPMRAVEAWPRTIPRRLPGTGAPPAAAMSNRPIASADWYGKAAAAGSATAATALGDLYAAGRGVAQSDGRAALWYRRGALAGEPWASTNLAELYLKGRGVPRDAAVAIFWYRRAAL